MFANLTMTVCTSKLRQVKSPALAGLSEKRLMGFEPTTFCMARRFWAQDESTAATEPRSLAGETPANSFLPIAGFAFECSQSVRKRCPLCGSLETQALDNGLVFCRKCGGKS